MPELSDHLSILGLAESASTAKLRTAYRHEIVKWHPDLFHDPANHPAALAHAKKITAAFVHLTELHENGSLPRPTSSTNGHQKSRPQSRQTYRTQHTYKGKPFTPGFPDPTVFEVFVKSAAIISAGYNRATRTLYLKFVGDRVYSYRDVPESVFAAFISAESHGKFAHRHIFHCYQYVSHQPTV